MKKFSFVLLGLCVTISCQALSLFPHFVDIAGDYQDGTGPKFLQLNIPTKHWKENPYFYKTISEADEFLKETLPFSNYNIDMDTQTLPDGTKIIKYSASLAEGILGTDETMVGKGSYLYLIQSPDEPLYIGIYEDVP